MTAILATPRVIITPNDAKEEIAFVVECGINSYIGSYDKEAASAHDGEIINVTSFMRVLKCALIKRHAYEISFSPDNEKAIISVKLTAFCMDETFEDNVKIICKREVFDESRTEERKLRLTCVELRESIENLRADLEMERKINIFQSKWGLMQACERNLIIELLKHDDILLPAVGCEWIQLGKRYFATTCLGIKVNNVVCCTAPQNAGRNMPTLYATILPKSSFGDKICVKGTNTFYGSAFFAGLLSNKLVKARDDMMRSTMLESLVVIGPTPVSVNARYIATIGEITLPAFTAMKVDNIAYFGFHLSGFNQYYNNKDQVANVRTSITTEFEKACAATEYLADIAEKSGMPKYSSHGTMMDVNGDIVEVP